MDEFRTNQILVAVYCCGAGAANSLITAGLWTLLALFYAVQMHREYQRMKREFAREMRS